MIQFSDVSVIYDSGQPLESVSFEIGKREFVYLTGPSGAGKSTILKLIYKAVFPDDGYVIVDDFDSRDFRRRHIHQVRRKIGVVFQDFRLLNDRSVYDNIAFVLRVTNVRRSQIRKKVLRALTEVGLSHKKDELPTALSGGEQQRVAIARAIVNEPFILIADEPTGNLDPAVSDEIMELLEKIYRRGTAILMATHDYRLIEKFPHRTLRIESGAIREL